MRQQHTGHQYPDIADKREETVVPIIRTKRGTGISQVAQTNACPITNAWEERGMADNREMWSGPGEIGKDLEGELQDGHHNGDVRASTVLVVDLDDTFAIGPGFKIAAVFAP